MATAFFQEPSTAIIFLGINDEWRESIVRWQQEEKLCTRCGTRYKEINNIGRWNCAQHALTAMSIDKERSASILKYNTKIFAQWKCCGRRQHEKTACVPADHTDKPRGLMYTEYNDFPMPTKIEHLFGRRNVKSCIKRWTDDNEAFCNTYYDSGDSRWSKDSYVNTIQQNEYITIRRFDKEKQDEIIGMLSFNDYL